MSAYKGATVHGFPNLFFIVGPEHRPRPLEHGLHDRVADRLRPRRAADDGRRRASARWSRSRTAQERWNRDIQRRMKRTVWSAGGCSSWYLDSHGRNVTLWPRTTFKFRQLTRQFDVEQYVVAAARPGTIHDDHEGGADRMRTFDGKVAVITGAGSGIGRALALDLAARGAVLALSDKDEVGLLETAERASARHARKVHTEKLDVSDRAAMAGYAASVAAGPRPGQRGVQQRRHRPPRRLRGDALRRVRADHGRQLLGRRARLQGVPPPPHRERRRPSGQHLQPLRPDGHACADRLQRLEVRRTRLHRGAAHGDADRPAPGAGLLRAPGRHQDRDRPQLPDHRAATTSRASPRCSTRSSPRPPPRRPPRSSSTACCATGRASSSATTRSSSTATSGSSAPATRARSPRSPPGSRPRLAERDFPRQTVRFPRQDHHGKRQFPCIPW